MVATSSKTLLLLAAGGILLFFVIPAGLLASYEALTHQDLWFVYLERFMVKNPQDSAKARLPDDMRGVAQDAADHFGKMEYDEAAACYQVILHKYPESLYAWSNLGVVRFQQGKFDEARVAFLQSVALSPNDAFSWANLGICYYQLQRYHDAIDALQKAIAFDPNDAKSYNYLGCCYSQTGEQAKAEAALKKALELNSKFGDAYFNLSLIYATASPPDLDQAKIDYQHALDLGIAKDPRLEKLISPSDDTK